MEPTTSTMNTTRNTKTLNANRRAADRSFNASCVALQAAIKAGKQDEIAKAYAAMSNALARCNALGLY